MLGRSWMRSVGAAAALLLTTAWTASAQPSVIVVRHAEKVDDSRDAALSPQGQARAKALAGLLRAAGVTHVVTSEYLRTRQTSAPLADALGLTAEQVPARDLPALVAKLTALDSASIVLVVAHSNTVPPLLNALGWTGTLELGEGDYDNVFVVTPRSGKPPAMLRLKYGQPTP